MPDFLSIDAALRCELNDKENTEEYHLYNNTLFDFEGQINEDFSLLLTSTPSTPDLVVEDYSDSDLSPSFSTFSNRNERKYEGSVCLYVFLL
jgi:hypothetical protein